MERKDRVKKLLAGLQTEQKLRLLCGNGAWRTDDLDGLLPQAVMSDGPVGLRTMRKGADVREETIPAVAYPSVQVLANTWNTSLAREMGAMLADDCRERGVNLLLAPGVNIKRHPLNGRNFEYFSEDPLLAGEMSKAYVEGLQENGVGACVKHFCCNNLEYDRLHQSSEVDERTLRELYYRPFAIACEAKPVSVMCSYNRINGTYASEYEKGFEMLRGDCGFDGAVISDWGAVRDRCAAAAAGLDLEMPFDEKNYKKLLADYEAGKLTDEQLDACAGRVIDLALRLEEMGKGKKVRSAVSEREEAAKCIAAEGMVLLKNDGALPLQAGAKVSVSGCYAKPDDARLLAGGGSSQVEWAKNAFDLPAALSACGFETVYEEGFGIDTIWSFRQDVRAAAENAAGSDVQIVCVGTGNGLEFEEGDRRSMRLPAVQEKAILEAAKRNKNTVVVIFAGAAIDMSAWIDDVNAVLFAGFPGMGGDEVLAELLAGKRNPSGKLSETFPLALADVPAANVPCGAGATLYREGLDVGYRYFATYGVPVLFPFGHGLSYSDFRYVGLCLKEENGALAVRFTIENVSARAGEETAQLYVRPCAPRVYRPDRELKAFSKQKIGAGGSVSVCCRLERSAFAYWSASRDCWTVDDGVYEILVGASSEDIRLCGKVRVENGLIRVL
mgnify:FL=1